MNTPELPRKVIVSGFEDKDPSQCADLLRGLGDAGLSLKVLYEDDLAGTADLELPEFDATLLCRLSALETFEPDGELDYVIERKDIELAAELVEGVNNPTYMAERIDTGLRRHVGTKFLDLTGRNGRRIITVNKLIGIAAKNELKTIPLIGDVSEKIILMTLAAKRLQIDLESEPQ